MVHIVKENVCILNKAVYSFNGVCCVLKQPFDTDVHLHSDPGGINQYSCEMWLVEFPVKKLVTA